MINTQEYVTIVIELIIMLSVFFSVLFFIFKYYVQKKHDKLKAQKEANDEMSYQTVPERIRNIIPGCTCGPKSNRKIISPVTGFVCLTCGNKKDKFVDLQNENEALTEIVENLSGQLALCISHLEHVDQKAFLGRYGKCIEQSNKVLYDTAEKANKYK